MPSARRTSTLTATVLALVATLGVAGCADFAQEAAPTSWHSAAPLSPEAAPNPEVPGMDGGSNGTTATGDPSSSTSVPPPRGCQDFNPAVIATCLNPISAVAMLPGTGADPIGLVAERGTGRILRVQKGHTPVLVTTVPVDAVGDGGLTGLALSPTYGEDQLVFAYVTTATDNRVLMIAPGDAPRPIVTGIPRGSTNNRGALALDNQGALLVATGNAGDPAAAGNPTSLAGKVLRIDVDGQPAAGNPHPGSSIVASGVADPGGLCASQDGSQAWLTDRLSTEDALYKLRFGTAVGAPAWAWPDRPGVAGCAAYGGSIMIAMSTAAEVQTLSLNSDGSFSGTPQVGLKSPGGFGRLSGVDAIGGQAAMVGTVNKDGGKPVSSDDRVVLIVGSSATGSSQD
ncbi:MAG TPA: PQQ-dependent sugar dehydrogenase [Pseudonocardiaceae bacterium]